MIPSSAKRNPPKRTRTRRRSSRRFTALLRSPPEMTPNTWAISYISIRQTASGTRNGYRISSAGCGPTSMAVVISSLTKKWVTPVDAAVWAYDHGYYSSAGSAHALIPAMAEAYGLKCEGVGTDYAAIKEALRKGNPVVALMGPGYFTRRGHFMVLIGIDENDHVTVADVGSRSRSAYKYALSDIISQSKSASAGGPFWVISKPKKKKKVKKTVTYTSPQNEYVIHVKEDGQDKAITFHLGDQVSYHGAEGIILRFENRKAYITGADGSDAIPLSDLQIVKHASGIVYTAIASRKRRASLSDPTVSHCGGFGRCLSRNPPQTENPALQDSFLFHFCYFSDNLFYFLFLSIFTSLFILVYIYHIFFHFLLMLK